MRRDFMTVRNIGKKQGKGLYRDIKGLGKNQEGILYYEDEGLLYRQVLPQDVEVVKWSRKIAAENTFIRVRNKKTNKIEVLTADKLIGEEKDEEILKVINSVKIEKGCISILVFDIRTKEFVAVLDVEPVPESDWRKGGVTFTLSEDRVIREKYGQMVKRNFNEICKRTGLFAEGCDEVIWQGNKPVFIPIE